MKQRWSHTEKRIVPFEASISQQISTAVPKKLPNGETDFNTLIAVATILVQRPNNINDPPCCAGTHNIRYICSDCLVPSQLVLTSIIVPINVLIDTSCMQTNVLSERQDGGKVFEIDVALTSGVGSVS